VLPDPALRFDIPQLAQDLGRRQAERGPDDAERPPGEYVARVVSPHVDAAEPDQDREAKTTSPIRTFAFQEPPQRSGLRRLNTYTATAPMTSVAIACPLGHPSPVSGTRCKEADGRGRSKRNSKSSMRTPVPKAAARRTIPEKWFWGSHLLQPSSKSRPPAVAPARSSTSGEKTASKTTTPVVRLGSP
jgi:hypothetical protein